MGARLTCQYKKEQFTKGKSEEANFVVQNLARTSNSGLLQQCLAAWAQLCEEKKRGPEIAEAKYKSRSKMEHLQAHTQASKRLGGEPSLSACEHHDVVASFCAWRVDACMVRGLAVFRASLKQLMTTTTAG